MNAIVVDIGNTKTALGWVQDGKIIQTWKIKTHKDRMADEYWAGYLQILEQACPQAASLDWVIASVVPRVTDELKSLAQTSMYFIDAHSPIDFTINIDTPTELGPDLIASAQGSIMQWKAPLIIIDAGTATTVMMVNRNQAFIGGSICPGMGISALAMSDKASALTTVQWSVPDSYFGKNTTQAVQNGLLRGHAGTITALVNGMKAESGEPDATVVVTGGAITPLLTLLPNDYIHSENLTLEGIQAIGSRMLEA